MVCPSGLRDQGADCCCSKFGVSHPDCMGNNETYIHLYFALNQDLFTESLFSKSYRTKSSCSPAEIAIVQNVWGSMKFSLLYFLHMI